MIRRIALTGLLAGAIVAGTGRGANAAAVGNANDLALGAAAPAFAAHALDGGRAIASQDYRGKILVLNFWATWCPPCRRETPDMIAAYHKLHAADVAFLGVDTTEVASVVKTFVSSKGLPYPVALAGPGAYNAYGVAYIPTTFVIDKSGIVRARWIGEISPARLTRFVADARAGTNAVLATPDQTMVERLLDPASFRYDGDAAQVGATAKRAKAAVTAAEAFANVHADGNQATIDYARVQELEGGVLIAAGDAALANAQSDAGRVAADRLIATADGKLNRFADAIAALRAAQQVAPSDAGLALAISKADYRLHDYADMIASAHAYTQARPDDADGWDWLGLADQRLRRFADSAPAYEKAIALMKTAVPLAKAAVDREDDEANVADASLDLADVYVALGDAPGAGRAFAQAVAFADRLDPKGTYGGFRRIAHERAQEGAIAVRLVRPAGKTALSVAPWTGPDLPGSLPSTLKYRLIVAARPSATVKLQALGLRSGWIASFCADGLCSPNRVSITMPASGVKTYEFQLVPPGSTRAFGSVKVRSADGTQAVVPHPS